MIADRLTPSTMEENPLWLVVLCDMMTNLMLFFLIMYVWTQQNSQTRKQWLQLLDAKAVVAAPEEKPDPPVAAFTEADAGKELSGLFDREGLAQQLELSEDQDTIRVRLREAVLFPTGRAELNAEAGRAIALLAGVLAKLPNELVVEGHTDSVPITKAPFASNWELSVARSYSVVERLIADGVAPERLVTAGYGEFHPIAGNDSPAGRSANRRIELVILRCRPGPLADPESDCRTRGRPK